MKNSRKFIQVFFIVLALFLAFHLFVWFFFTSKIFNTDPYYIGDLARMGYQIDSLSPRKDSCTLPKRYLTKTSWDGKNVDVVTIGDSFSNGGAKGSNPYYQDYLATKYNVKVLNVQSWDLKYDYIDIVNILANNGWIEKIRPKAIIIETVQREVVNRYAKEHDFALNIPLHDVEKKLFDRAWGEYVPNVSLVNTGNYKYVYYASMYKYKEHVEKDVYKFSLKQPLFSVKADTTLLVYADEITRLDQQISPNLQKVNDNLNKLAQKLNKQHVKLYFLVPVDKYDLYYDYLVNQQYGRNMFFDYFKKLKKEYVLIDTKEILLPYVQKGVKDIFYADDTHWSYKASDIITNDKVMKEMSTIE